MRNDTDKEPIDVLIVEDSPTQAESLKYLLERNHYKVIVAENGKQALARFNERKPTLVISDIVMPEMDGFELCKQIKLDENNGDVPVILLTSLSSSEDVLEGLACGADNFITKPYNEDYLISSVENILTSRKLRKGGRVRIGVEITFGGKKRFVTADQQQMLTLLISTYEAAVQRNSELVKAQNELSSMNERLDETVRERTERIRHLTSVLQGIRNVNQLIVREKHPARLIHDACQKLIETRGFNFAWIALLDGSKKITLTAEAGLGDSFQLMEEKLKRGEFPSCVGKALEQPGVVITKDTSSTCGDCPLAGGKYVGSAGMTMRLEHEGKVYGLIGLSIPLHFAEDEEELGLFEEVAGDIAFGLYGIEQEEKRKRAEDGLRESEERYSTLFRNAVEGILVADMETKRFVYANPSICRMLGYSEDEIKRLGVQDIHPAESLEHVLSEFEAMALGKRPLPMELPCQRKDGSVIYADITASGMILNKRHCNVGFFSDITERKRAEDALKESEERFRSLFEQAADCIILMEIMPDGLPVIRDANSATSRILGYEHSELIGKPVSFLTTNPNDMEPIKERRRKVLSREATVFEDEHRCKDGTIRVFECSVKENHVGSRIFAISVERDITERKKLEQQLHQAMKMEAVGRLAGGVAHDFNNILSVIISYAGFIIQELRENDPMREDAQEIKDAGYRAAALTKQLLAFSRKETIKPEVLNLNNVVENLNKMLRRIIGEDIEFAAVLEKDLGNVKVDPGQMEQVLANLAVNARDAMPEGGKLLIETKNAHLDEQYSQGHISVLPGSYVMLAVSDTGCGMDAKTLTQIFEPFFTTKDVGKGTGLGLATVYGIVKQNNGYVLAYSEPGQGTSFKIYLPLIESDVVPIKDVKISVDDSLRGTETILLAEDEEAVRKIASRILKKNGYTVIEAGNGGEALLACERHDGPIHLLLTDVIMPQMSGKALAERLKKIRPEIKAVYMSGYTNNAIAHQGVLDEGVNFVQKPFAEIDLLKMIRKALSTLPV